MTERVNWKKKFCEAEETIHSLEGALRGAHLSAIEWETRFYAMQVQEREAKKSLAEVQFTQVNAKLGKYRKAIGVQE